MPIYIEDKEADTAIKRLSSRMSIPTSKSSLAVAVLRRAGRMTPETLMDWLRESDASHADTSATAAN